jgi:hypothetical protein
MDKIIKLVPDALIVGGAGALSYGAGLLHPAAGFITAGALMLIGGALSAINAQRAKATA